jgi:gamma-glutamylaminecyclotransferase
MATALLFVYGSLKRGQHNHRLLRGQTFVAEAATLPRYRLLDLGPYPGLVQAAAGGRPIRGEVWRVDAATLARLDRFEGVPHLYDRRPVELADGPQAVEAYFYNRDAAGYPECGTSWPAVPSG